MKPVSRAWGQHLVLDLNGCPRHLLTDPKHLRAWVAELVETISMRAYGEPVIEHFATDTHDSAGYTVMQLIETSNICAHFAENLGQVYIDIFSCRSFDNAIAEEVCRRYFRPAATQRTCLERGVFGQTFAQAG